MHEKFLKSEIVILTDYKGLDVVTMNELRTRLREEETEFRVVKNTLLTRASKDTDVAVISEQFKGPSAIALNYKEPVAPAKTLIEFAKKYEKFEVRAAAMKGKTLDVSDIKALASLPSREILLTKLVLTMNAVPTGFVTALSDIPRRLLNVLNAVKEQKSGPDSEQAEAA